MQGGEREGGWKGGRQDTRTPSERCTSAPMSVRVWDWDAERVPKWRMRSLDCKPCVLRFDQLKGGKGERVQKGKRKD